jgi:bifunctional non-homologous end joining protein LigD
MSGSEKKITISGKKLTVTNREKIFWPEDKITKGDVMDYYSQISKVILPYLRGRPQSLRRHPDGITDPGFFQKDAGENTPEWIATQEIRAESTGEQVEYILCNDKPTLMYLNNLGCIELNPWNSKIKWLDFPDYLVIDLDPSSKNDFDDVVAIARVVKEILDRAGAPACCKTSGASGMHIYVPLGARYPYAEVRAFAELIANLVQQAAPELATLERSLKKRESNKIYVDYLQNAWGQTLVSAYSLRARPGAPVSTPLLWKEVKRGLRPEAFSMRNISKRISRHGDLFRDVLKKSIDLKKCVRSLNH